MVTVDVKWFNTYWTVYRRMRHAIQSDATSRTWSPGTRSRHPLNCMTTWSINYWLVLGSAADYSRKNNQQSATNWCDRSRRTRFMCVL